MDLLVSHVVLGVVFGVFGWWLHGRWQEKSPLGAHHDGTLVKELMSSLHCLSLRMAADVGEHNFRVGEVGKELETKPSLTQASVETLVERLVRANRDVQKKLSQTEDRLEQVSQKMEAHASEARTDVLTGLANRRAFEEEATRRVTEFREGDHLFTLVMIDIDHFKKFNDAHGHLIGDEVLRSVGLTLLENLRGRDFIARFGGEEFAVIMPRTSVHDAGRGAEVLREVIQQARFNFGDKRLSVTISAGVAEVKPFEDVMTLVKRADEAMYAAKGAGRNSVFWHDGALPQPLQQEQPLQHEEIREPFRIRGASVDPSEREPEFSPVRPARDVPAPNTQDDSANLELIEPDGIDFELLNNLGNKTMFCQSIHRRIAEWNRRDTTFSTMLLGVDNFDELAEFHGEATAKMFLGIVARAIRHNVRDMDMVARYNDVTFGLVVPEATLKNAICIGERLRKEIQRTGLIVNGQPVHFTISLGIVEVSDGDDMASIVERARMQLVRASSKGGNRSVATATLAAS